VATLVHAEAEMRPLPRDWSALAGLDCIAETDIRPTPHGRLYAKLMVFEDAAGLRRFWKNISEDRLGPNCLAAVNMLAHWTESLGNGSWKRRMDVLDQRYFCVIGLVVGHLTMEVITHEAVHAGFCYAKRVKRCPWDNYDDFDEELVAYPAGRIARQINKFLHDQGVYPT
jgi:hypothetical protein